MQGQKRKYLFYTFLTITTLTILVWLVSKYIQPILPLDFNSDLVLIMACLIGVITILTNIPDVYERIVNLFPNKISGVVFTEKEKQHNRQMMLTFVWKDWIEDGLKESLYKKVLIELGLESYPDAVENPWDKVLQMPKKAPVTIPASKKILDIFNESGESLLILGEPGCGKTTVLLELASQAITLAKKNPQRPIPVVFNLLTWTLGLTFKDWLLNEFQKRYNISPKIANYWIDNNELMLLLDGLDEVKKEYSEQCIRAINTFVKQQIVPIAICCRKNEFDTLTTRIKVRGIIIIQPLSSEQAVKYLQKAGSHLVDFYNKIKIGDADPESHIFIHRPLFLNILILAYKDAPVQDLDLLVKSGNFQKHLFDCYIDKMLTRRGKLLYPIKQTKKWLAWLADRMYKNDISEFYIENIKPNWIEDKIQRRKERKPISKPTFQQVVDYSKRPVYKLKWSWLNFFKKSLVFLIGTELVSGLFFGLLVMLIRAGARKLGIMSITSSPIDDLGYGVTFGLAIGFINAIYFGLFSGLSEDKIEIYDKPDQSLRNSFWNSLIVGTIFGLFLGLSSGLISSMGEPIIRLVFGLFGGLCVGLIYGGGFIISHFLLRWQLYRADKIPFRLIKFLNFATERIFLRKVGGRYIFIHRMLMKHFAEMEKDI